MKKIIINENQKGFLFKNGRFVRLLGAGKYYTFGSRKIEMIPNNMPIMSDIASLDTLLANSEIAEKASVIEVGDNERVLHYVNGKFDSILPTGKYAFWSDSDKHEFKTVDITSPEVSADIPEYIFSKIPQEYFVKIWLDDYAKARVYFNKKLAHVLDSGVYYFWNNGMMIDYDFVDMRRKQMPIVGQEILTKDKVSIRVNFVCDYRVTDCVQIKSIEDFEAQLYVWVQLALREYVGGYRLDEILDNKDQISEFVFSKLKEKEEAYFVEVLDAGVKDIILPGEIREIMNTVLVAEKRAQANVITRREEVASTRSLLNTAKLMDENKTLYKLKELEYVERICENVGNININGNSDVISQLSSLLRSNE